ncbi:MAG: DUF2799 domain-containing protein [Gammaproteobacteria bacterium]
MKKKTRHIPFYTRHLPLAGITLLVLLLQGCATLDRDQCRVADWRLIGYQDGVQGKPSSIIGTYREDCAKHAIVPDLDAWQAGRAQGLQEYCTPANAFRLGRSGHAYPGVCPGPADAAFETAYGDGRAIYLARSEVKDTHAQIHRREKEIDALYKDKEHKLVALVQDGLQKEQRVLLLYQIHEIDQEIEALDAEIDSLEYDLQVQQAYLDSLVSTISR